MKFNKTKALRELKIVADTYKLGNRAVIKHSEDNIECFYVPNSKQTFTCGCAVGQRLTPEEQDKVLKLGINEGSIGKVLKHFTPKYAVGLTEGFLYDLQGLHDEEVYWNYEGLSEEGKERYEYIKNQIKNEYYTG